MLRIFDKQSTGKTQKLLSYAKDNNCVVICSNPARMKDKALRYNLGSIECLSYEEFIGRYKYGVMDPADYLIDEPEKLLNLLFINNAKFVGFDMTTEY